MCSCMNVMQYFRLPCHLLNKRWPPRAIEITDDDLVCGAVEQRVLPHPPVQLSGRLYLRGMTLKRVPQ